MDTYPHELETKELETMAKLPDYKEITSFRDISYRVEWLEYSHVLREKIMLSHDFPVDSENFLSEKDAAIDAMKKSMDFFETIEALNFPVQLTKWTTAYEWINSKRTQTIVSKLLHESE